MNATRSLIAGLALVILGTLPASSESIQLEQLHGIYMVPVRINDAVAIPFVLDSGAAEVAITEDVFLVLLRRYLSNMSPTCRPAVKQHMVQGHRLERRS